MAILGIDESVQILLEGIRFNANEGIDPDGCYWPAQMTGWSSRITKSQRTPKPVLPGSYRAPNPTAEKTISLAGYCIAPSSSVRSKAENRLQAICPDPSSLYRMDVTEEDGTRFRLVELDNVDIKRFNETVFTYTIQVTAIDPMKYGLDLLTATAGLPGSGSLGLDWNESGTGLNWADAVGLDWGIPGTTSVISLINGGMAPAWPIFTLSAGANPLVNPVITDQGTGRQLKYSGTLAPGDVIVIDTNPFSRSVLQGTADRRPFLTRAEWFSIPANGSSAVAFTADVYSATALLTAQWRNTYF